MTARTRGLFVRMHGRESKIDNFLRTLRLAGSSFRWPLSVSTWSRPGVSLNAHIGLFSVTHLARPFNVCSTPFGTAVN
jgi:hypothetical protein